MDDKDLINKGYTSAAICVFGLCPGSRTWIVKTVMEFALSFTSFLLAFKLQSNQETIYGH